jgi:hypothetical protein
MTPINQFDPFERRITDAIDEIASPQRPAYLDDVLRLTARTSQRSRRAFWRHTSMNRLAYAAAAIAVVAVLAGGALLFKPSASNGGPPSPAPTGTTSPTASSTPALAPESLRSSWLASSGPAASAGTTGSFLRLVISARGDRLSVFDAGVESLVSSPIAGPTTEFDIISTGTAGGCQVGDVGSYGFAFGTDGSVPASDGTRLALTVKSDACAARSTMLSRGWTHAAGGNGGRGIATSFMPMFLITLPAAAYTADPGTDSVTLASTTPDRTLIAVKNPVGFTDPCAPLGGAKLPVAPTIKAFTAYMRTLPGFTVQSTALQIDGHAAVHLVIPSTQTATCSGSRVNEWTASTDAGTGGWLLRQGETDVVYLVEVGSDLILLQWLGQDVTPAEEQALFATVHFTDVLPQ